MIGVTLTWFALAVVALLGGIDQFIRSLSAYVDNEGRLRPSAHFTGGCCCLLLAAVCAAFGVTA